MGVLTRVKKLISGNVAARLLQESAKLREAPPAPVKEVCQRCGTSKLKGCDDENGAVLIQRAGGTAGNYRVCPQLLDAEGAGRRLS